MLACWLLFITALFLSSKAKYQSNPIFIPAYFVIHLWASKRPLFQLILKRYSATYFKDNHAFQAGKC
ncbi:hypothetical protein CS542_04895 [Pedobacter sp. IW39]|nr:hypothetical protein CS542_04895 [Pedobacter sp. IW39]